MPRILRFRLFGLFLFTVSICHSQSFIPAYQGVVDQCSQSAILASLTEFQNLGVKYRGTTAQANALNWLRNKYLSYGYSASQMVEDPFTYSGSTCKNLVLTKVGTTYPNTYVIVDGHYDTLTGPGTNDNGSGTSIILELARLLVNVPTEYSIKFINFAGEEDGLIGSQHYVTSVVNSTTPKMDIRLVLNIDEVGGVSTQANTTITCEKDTSNSPSANNAESATRTTELANCIELYSTLNTTISYAYASDYMPFEDNGEIITGLYETNESPYPHSVNDVLANMDPTYVYNVAQGTIGAVLHFAVACTSCTLSTPTAGSDSGVVVYPNPAKNVLYIGKGGLETYDYELVNVLGQSVRSKKLAHARNLESIDVGNLQKGMYVLLLQSGKTTISKKLIID